MNGNDPTRWWARGFAGLFLLASLTNIVLVSRSATAYDSFADGSYLPFVTHIWRSVFVPNVYVFIALLAGFEATVGVLMLPRRTRRLAIACAIAFNVALMLFGWGFWLWSPPVIVLLGYFWRRAGRPNDPSDQPRQTAVASSVPAPRSPQSSNANTATAEVGNSSSMAAEGLRSARRSARA